MNGDGLKDDAAPFYSDEETCRCKRRNLTTAPMNDTKDTMNSYLKEKINTKHLNYSDRVACSNCARTCTGIDTTQGKGTMRTQKDGSSNANTERNVDIAGPKGWLGPSHYSFIMGFYSSRYGAIHDRTPKQSHMKYHFY